MSCMQETIVIRQLTLNITGVPGIANSKMTIAKLHAGDRLRPEKLMLDLKKKSK